MKSTRQIVTAAHPCSTRSSVKVWRQATCPNSSQSGRWRRMISGLLATTLVGSGTVAAASTIVVDTLTDTADAPFTVDAQNCAATGTVSDLPGADGHISLREAIIAADNNPGADTITVSVSGMIPLTHPLPFLCKGNTTISGDTNGDNVPDITLDGGGTVNLGLFLISGDNTINAVRVQNLSTGGSGITVYHNTSFLATSAANNTITNNIVTGGGYPFVVVAGTSTGGGFAGAINNTTLTGNSGSGGSFDGLVIFTSGPAGSRIEKTTVASNTFSNNAFAGIQVTLVSPHSTISGLAIRGNTTANDEEGISISGGLNAQASDNTVSATVRDNTITGNIAPSGATSGIFIGGGIRGAAHNAVTVHTAGNTISGNVGFALGVIGGQDNSSSNTVDVSIQKNTIENNTAGISVSGGVGAFLDATGTSTENTVNAAIQRNVILHNNLDSLLIIGGWGSGDGRANAVAHDNTVIVNTLQRNALDHAGRNGMNILGAGPGDATHNVVKGGPQNILRNWRRGSTEQLLLTQNMACANTNADLIVLGAVPPGLGVPPTVGIGNIAEVKIVQNVASVIAYADGPVGNIAAVSVDANSPCLSVGRSVTGLGSRAQSASSLRTPESSAVGAIGGGTLVLDLLKTRDLGLMHTGRPTGKGMSYNRGSRK